MKAALAVLLLMLAGCATSRTTYLPDGRQGHAINCSGAALSWDMCYQKAGEACKEKGYDILAKDGEDGTTVTGTQFGVFGGSVMKRTLLVACKG